VPICKDFTLGALRTADSKVCAHGQAAHRIPQPGDGDARTGNVQDAAGRALAAGKQNKGWYYIELCLHQQGEETANT